MAVIATDDFNRANGAIGANWTTQSPGYETPQIVSNALRDNSAGSGEGCAWYNAWSGAGGGADHYSQVKVVAQDTNSSFAAHTRMSAGNMYYWIMDTGSGGTRNYYFGKFVSSSYTDLATGSTAFANNDVIRCEAQGTTIRGKVNGSTIQTQTDSALASGSPGLQVGVQSGTPLAGNIVDDWEGGNFAAGGGTKAPPPRRQPWRIWNRRRAA